MRAQTPNLPSQVRQGVSRQYRMRRHPADTTAAPTRPARTQHKDVAPDRQGKVAAAYELPDQAVSPAPMRKVVKQLSSYADRPPTAHPHERTVIEGRTGGGDPACRPPPQAPSFASAPCSPLQGRRTRASPGCASDLATSHRAGFLLLIMESATTGVGRKGRGWVDGGGCGPDRPLRREQGVAAQRRPAPPPG